MDTILDIAPARCPGRCPGRCPNFPTVFKRKVVEASYQPGSSVSRIAREHDVNANMVFRWRQQYLGGAFGPVSQSATLLPVEVIDAPISIPTLTQSMLRLLLSAHPLGSFRRQLEGGLFVWTNGCP
ncbi:transposase [Pseudomonas sp. P154a]|uniref:transposase n=1 Tax=Pseudomonas mucoides TaxID=2730424 RepID=UPI0018924932|nr:transposase [Pseudomonas mucoides]